MDAKLALGLIVEPALDWLSGFGIAPDRNATRMMLAVAGQESGYAARRQAGGGPAHGWWQFERGGAAGVLGHPASQRLARLSCAALLVAPTADAVHAAIEQNDMLACIFARLLLLTDPAPMPVNPDMGWTIYARCWRPGAPRPADWPRNWQAADAALEVAQ